jgi:hypothetical protein
MNRNERDLFRFKAKKVVLISHQRETLTSQAKRKRNQPKQAKRIEEVKSKAKKYVVDAR